MLKQYARFVLMAAVCTACLLSVGATPAEAGRTRMVLGFYYAWYDTGSFGHGTTPFQPVHAYNSTSSATIRRQVKTAKAAGMDGFVQSWYGDNPNQQTEPNFQTLLDISQEQGFKATVHFESVSPFFGGNQDRIDSLKTVVYTHAKHPAFLRMDGKPVIFFWANWALSVNDWEYIRNQVDPGRTTIWMAEGGHTEYLSVFDGLHLYNVSWSGDPGGVNHRWANETRNYNSTKYWAGTAMPGFDNSLVPGVEHTIRSRNNGSYLRTSFQGAAASDPDLLLVTSFNEWREGSNIEASTAWGNSYINTLRSLSAEYKGMSAASFPAVPSWLPAATPTPYPSWTPPPTWTPIPVTNTPIPTNTPISTWTPIPIPATDTPWPTNTARPAAPTNTPYPTATDAPRNAPNTLIEAAIGSSSPRNRSARPSPTPTPQELAQQELAQTDGYIVYTVQEGDTLGDIALRYGISEAELRDLNDLTDNTIITGQQLILGVVGNPQPTSVPEQPTQPASSDEATTSTTSTLPAPQADGSILYDVEAEETVSQIATRFGLPIEDVLSVNGFPNDLKVRPGNQLLLGYLGADGDVRFTQDEPDDPEPTDVPAAIDTPNPNVTPTAQPNGEVLYIVQENESVYSITEKFGLSMNTVLRLNGLTEESVVQVGAPLLLGEVDPSQVVAAAPDAPDTVESESPVNTSTRFAEATLREDGLYIHTVQTGDTATGIALQYGYTTMPDFYRASGLNPTSILTIGDQIIVGEQPVPQNVGGSTDTEDVLPTATSIPLATATPLAQPTPVPPTVPAVTSTAIPINIPQPTQEVIRIVGEPTQANEIVVANEIMGNEVNEVSDDSEENDGEAAGSTTPRAGSPLAAVALGSFGAILVIGLVLLYWLLFKKE